MNIPMQISIIINHAHGSCGIVAMVMHANSLTQQWKTSDGDHL